MGEETYQRTRSPENCWTPSKRASGLLCRRFWTRKNRALTPEAGGKRTVRGGVHPPMASSELEANKSTDIKLTKSDDKITIKLGKIAQKDKLTHFLGATCTTKSQASWEIRSLRHDNKISRLWNSHFQNFIVVALPTKSRVFGRFSSLPPKPPPPPQKRKFYFYCRLAVSDWWLRFRLFCLSFFFFLNPSGDQLRGTLSWALSWDSSLLSSRRLWEILCCYSVCN